MTEVPQLPFLMSSDKARKQLVPILYRIWYNAAAGYGIQSRLDFKHTLVCLALKA